MKNKYWINNILILNQYNVFYYLISLDQSDKY